MEIIIKNEAGEYIASIVGGIPNEISIREGTHRIGVLDHNGKVVIPFECISFSKHNGKILIRGIRETGMFAEFYDTDFNRIG